jgi:hypothetical protein
MLTIEWVEIGGPEVLVPARPGYGSSVIRDLLAYELGGKADLFFAPGGVRCTIELPVQATVEASEQNASPPLVERSMRLLYGSPKPSFARSALQSLRIEKVIQGHQPSISCGSRDLCKRRSKNPSVKRPIRSVAPE